MKIDGSPTTPWFPISVEKKNKAGLRASVPRQPEDNDTKPSTASNETGDTEDTLDIELDLPYPTEKKAREAAHALEQAERDHATTRKKKGAWPEISSSAKARSN